MPRGRPRVSDATQGDPEDVASADFALPPFFNTTYSIHRVSPLYVGSEKLTTSRLEHLSHRLRDTLVGDVVRGIQIGLESTDIAAGQVGPLRVVNIRWFQSRSVLGEASDDSRPPSRDLGSDPAAQSGRSQGQGLWIEVRHENAGFVAVLLPGSSRKTDDGNRLATGWAPQSDAGTQAINGRDNSQFIDLPLLLLRMPLALKSVICDWLASTFDCHLNRVTLGTKTIVNVWEQWLQAMGVPSKGPDVVLTLAFNAPLPDNGQNLDADEGSDVESPRPGLRSIAITIPAQDLRRFVRAGEKVPRTRGKKSSTWENDMRERRRLAGPNADDGWAWRNDRDALDHPFTNALAHYLDHHLALDLFHPGVHVTQITCGGFVLARSRLKIVKIGEVDDDLSRAAWMFVTELGERVRGGALPMIFS